MITPIKRKPFLKELSKDHHFGLLFCWKLKEGLKLIVEPERLKAYVNFFWNGHLEVHFKEEERLLFNDSSDTLCEKALSEHQLIYDRILAIQTDQEQDTQLYASLIEMINNHIRFEERIVFPHLEQTLDEKRLIFIQEELSRSDEPAFVDNFPDEFWIKPKIN